jgi:hypothetical protein
MNEITFEIQRQQIKTLRKFREQLEELRLGDISLQELQKDINNQIFEKERIHFEEEELTLQN